MPLRYQHVRTLIPIDWQNIADQAADWLRSNVLVPSLLVQAISVLLLVLLMWWSAPRLRSSVLGLSAHGPTGPLHLILVALAQVGGWIALLLLLWFDSVAFNALGQRADLLRLAESLVLVWVLVRLSSMLVRDERLARVVAVLAWIIAALNIAGLITPVIGLLDAMAMPIGNYRISVLLVLKGAITLAIFIWLANALARLIEQRLRVFSPLTPVMQVLASKLVRLTLLTLAVVLALGSIGIDLTAFAVFSGAVGVGVGFGLQKVVSNLVSGVILLLDRSIKPGDVIEIDGTYGSVATLNARYASVQTRDGKEFLVPNEDLITQRVTNWSFSNDLIRQHVKVGISYQSDPHEAIRLALEAARDVPRVLSEPAPNCLLVNFGDSTIDLELRFWIRDPVNGTTNVRSEVMLNLWDLYQEHGVELPAPQRELTLRNPHAVAQAFAAMPQPAAKTVTLSSRADHRN